MHKHFYKILFIFLLSISHLQASKQSENINVQEQINNLKIEIAVLKSKQEFYDKQTDDKSQIISIENQLKDLESKLNDNRQDTKVFDTRVNTHENKINMQDNRISDNFTMTEITIAFFGILITVIIVIFAIKLGTTVKNEARQELKDWIDNKADEEFQSKVDDSLKKIEIKASELLKKIDQNAKEKFKKIDIITLKLTDKGKEELSKKTKKLETKNENEFTLDDWDLRATNEYHNGSKEKALSYLNSALDLDSNNADILFKIGFIFYDLKDYNNAIKYYKKAIDEEHIGAMKNLSLLYKNELNDTENANKYLKMKKKYEEKKFLDDAPF